MNAKKLMVFALATCGFACESSNLDYVGTLGTETSIQLNSLVPVIDVVIKRGETNSSRPDEPRSMLIDTGSPVNFIPADTTNLDGEISQTISLEAFGLTFPELPALAFEEISETSPRCEGPIMSGIIGGELLQHFRVGFDYAQRRMALGDSGSELAWFTEESDAIERLPMEVLGGGNVTLQSASFSISIPATRLLVEARIEDQTPTTALIDTGASFVVLRKSLFDTMNDSARPQFCCQSVSFIGGRQDLVVTRIRSIRLGDLEFKQLPALVMQDDTLFTTIEREAGKRIDWIIGGSLLRYATFQLDYAAREVQLARFRDPKHIKANEFILPGFSFCKQHTESRDNAAPFLIVDVYRNTDAASQGLRSGDRITGIDGQTITSLSYMDVEAMIQSRDAGSSVQLAIERGTGEKSLVSVMVYNMLTNF